MALDIRIFMQAVLTRGCLLHFDRKKELSYVRKTH